jgi:circadian clock protein KaiC
MEPSMGAAGGVDFGIAGLDQVFARGIPAEALVLVQGVPGTGKTTLALQFLLHGVAKGERCLLVSNAENPAQIHAVAATHGWDLAGLRILNWSDQGESVGQADADADDYTLFPEAEVEVGESLGQLFAEVDRVRPARLVIDTISALRALAPTPAYYRRQLRRLRNFLLPYGCTTVIIDDGLVTEKDARSQTLSDGIIELQQLDLNYGGDRRRLRVRKMRGTTYIGGYHDFRIEKGGLAVFPRLVAAAREEEEQRDPPALSGVGALDGLVGGGLPRGSSTLIMGPAGSGKSTLAATYMRAAAERGERSVLCLFDESVRTCFVRCGGLGIDMEGMAASGQVLMDHLDPAERTPGEIAGLLVRQVEEHDVRLVVLDTLNGYLQSGAEEPMVLLHLRELLTYLSRRQVVTILILTQHGILGAEMGTPIDVSFIADNVLLLRFFESDGSIRQVLSVVKKREGKHERTIRELSLQAEGISLSEPLTGFAGLLSGTPYRSGPADGRG